MENTIKVKINNIIANKEILGISVLAIASSLIAGQYVIYLCILVLLITLSYLYGEKFLVSIVIISLFTLVGDFNKELRPFIQIVDFGILSFLFLKRFGFQFELYPRVPKVLFYFILLYYCSMIISMVFSDYPFAGVGNILRQTVFFAIAYYFYSLIKDSSYIKTYVTALVIATAILAISTIYLFIIDGYSLIELNLGLRSRVSGLIGNPNILTNFYIISVPILVLSLMFYRNAIKKSVVVSILILFIVGLTLTISRTAILGVLLSTLFIFFLFRKKYFYWSMFCLVLMVLNILIYEPFGSLTSLLFRLERGLAGREFIWDISIGIIKDNPIFGIGVGVFKLEMFNYFPIMLDSWVGRELVKLHEITATGTNLSHNLFLGFYTDMGIVGFSTAIFFATIFFRTGIKTLIIYKSIDSKDYYLILALFLGGATMFVRALFDSVGILSYGVITSDLPFWLIFGSLLHYYKNHPHNFIKE